ncbi:MAG: decarboxylating 6-phosphogluconate dehydrogenase [Planctomycetes bacterium]|nr:decarboxylating 6-phosphogluconate dehydrogenase [Planctomycetota bacterium]
MRLGIVGLGKMGANMAARLLAGGHEVVGTNRSPDAIAKLTAEGGQGVDDLAALVAALPVPRVVWLMIPADAVDAALDDLLPRLQRGDVVVDGGNSNYKDSMRRGQRLRSLGMSFVDCGTSGGIWGRTEGYSLMVGGDVDAVARVEPALKTLAPSPDSGWGRVGPSGAGHFVKMVHNGIEYGLMQAYAEGFDLLAHKTDFGLDLEQVAQVWRTGSVVRSWLLDLVADALGKDPQLEQVAPFVPDSGEGRWTVDESVELAVPAPVIALSLMMRFRSRDERRFGDRLLSALRNEFGGHAVKAAE